MAVLYPGGPIPLMHVTLPICTPISITGNLQSESDPDGAFYFFVPEPTSLLLFGMGAMMALAIRHNRGHRWLA